MNDRDTYPKFNPMKATGEVEENREIIDYFAWMSNMTKGQSSGETFEPHTLAEAGEAIGNIANVILAGVDFGEAWTFYAGMIDETSPTMTMGMMTQHLSSMNGVPATAEFVAHGIYGLLLLNGIMSLAWARLMAEEAWGGVNDEGIAKMAAVIQQTVVDDSQRVLKHLGREYKWTDTSNKYREN